MKDKTIATLLAFFVGFIGIHKFYLGEIFGGIMYFIFSWTMIPALFSFFDFVGLIITSQEAFDFRYNARFMAANNQRNGLMLESSKDKAAALRELQKLFEEGIITAEEYEQKRRKILDSI